MLSLNLICEIIGLKELNFTNGRGREFDVMMLQVLKIFLYLILIISVVGCEQYHSATVNKIVFEKGKRIEIPEEIKKKPLTSEEIDEILKLLPCESQIVIMDENGENQNILIKVIKEIEKEESLGTPICSPDGEKILFILSSDREGEKYSIWVMNTDATNQVKLISEDSLLGAPIWSPDGSQIAFSANKSGNYEIYIIDVNEKRYRKLHDSSTDEFPRVYVPNDKKIIFVRGKVIYDPAEPYKEYEDFDICAIDIDGKNLKKLTHILTKSAFLSLSPDGEKIVYENFCKDNYEIFIMDKDGKNQNRLTYNSVRDVAPIWSPDGKKIAYVSDGMLYLMDPDGKNQIKLTDKSQCYVSYGVWSPDGKKIAFVAEGDIYIIDIDSKNLKNLTNTPDWVESNPSWRPIAKNKRW